LKGGRDIAKPYAIALAGVARDGGDVEAYLAPLDAFAQAIYKEPAAMAIFSSPYLSRSQRAELAGGIADDLGMPAALANFIRLVARRRRGGLLRQMVEVYREICDDEGGRVKGRVVSAVAIADELRDGIGRSLAKLLGRKPELAFEEDAALVGGFVVFVENRMYDLSVRGALARLAGEET